MLSVFEIIRLNQATPAVAHPLFIRRRIMPGAGKALEILAHALEYLSDECAVSGAAGPSLRARMDAIRLLGELNRRIYMECPEAQSTGERCRALLRRCFT